MNALHSVCEQNWPAAADFLLRNGIRLDSIDEGGRSALHIAAGAGHLDLVQRLLQGGADPSMRDYTGNTPLHLALANRDLQLVQVLLVYQSPLNIMNNTRQTPYRLACETGDVTLVRELLMSGAEEEKSANVRTGAGVEAGGMRCIVY